MSVIATGWCDICSRTGSCEHLNPSKAVKTKAQIETDLLAVMKGILRSGVTSKALRKPSKMTIDDIVISRHLYERLGVAFAAIGALRNYSDLPRGYKVML